MTDQEKISRLASAAAGSTSSFPSNPASNPNPVVIGRPFAIRKTLCSECHASDMPLPFYPRVAFFQEARILLGDRHAGTNHRRPKPYSRPTLASASCCLLCSLGALFVTSPRGEESLVVAARTVIQASSDASMMASNATSDGE